jgi:predicted O-methyltransferase YrrM
VQVDALDQQAAWLREVVAPYAAEYADNLAYRTATALRHGPGFGYVEAQVLHGFVRHARPARIIEVGSGVSTYCMIEALTTNHREHGTTVELTCVEPHPSDYLRSAPVQLIERRVQDLDPELFGQLDAGDLLFIDSTHTVAIGSDVVFIVLEVLPRLRPGVIVHFHDIFMPYTFPRKADRTIFQWMETALLQAYLAKGSDRVLCSLSMMHYGRRDVLQSICPGYRPQRDIGGLAAGGDLVFDNAQDHFPSSLYLRIT